MSKIEGPKVKQAEAYSSVNKALSNVICYCEQFKTVRQSQLCVPGHEQQSNFVVLDNVALRSKNIRALLFCVPDIFRWCI